MNFLEKLENTRKMVSTDQEVVLYELCDLFEQLLEEIELSDVQIGD